MKQKGFSLMLVISLFLLLVSCTSSPPDNGNASSSVIVVDQRGKEIVLPSSVERVVTIPFPAASLFYTIDGSSDHIVGMHPRSQEAVKESILEDMAPMLLLVNTGFIKSGFEANVEELLKLKPDVVFQWADKGDAIITPLEEAGIPVIGLKYGTQGDLEDGMRIMGKVSGKEQRAKGLIRYHHEVENFLISLSENLTEKRPRVLYLPYGAELKTTGQGTYNDFYINLTGGINVAHDLSDWQTVSMEQIHVWNPEIILVGNFAPLMPKDILRNTIDGQDWAGIDAVENKRVYKAPLGGYRWDPPNQESPLMWEWLFGILHPSLTTFNLRDEMRVFYEGYYGYQLSDQDISRILRCEVNTDKWCTAAP